MGIPITKFEIVSLSAGLKLLTVSNPKTIKGSTKGYITGILHLAPAWQSGRNTCPAHTLECAASCLYFAGRGAMTKIQKARIARTNLFYDARDIFLTTLKSDINRLFYNARRLNCEPAIRLNGTSDIRWENFSLIEHFPDMQFYDYTKITNRRITLPNYHLTFSFDGHNLAACMEALQNGTSVAVPFLGTPPSMWRGYPVVSGDDDDLRFLGTTPVILALRAKGRLRKDPTSTFLGDNHA